MNMKILLVESKEPIRNDLLARLSLYQGVEVIAMVDTVEDALSFLRGHTVDVVISNVQPAPVERTSDGSHLVYHIAQGWPDVQTVLYGDVYRQYHQEIISVCTGILTYPINYIAFQNVMNRLIYVWRLQQFKNGAADRSILVKTREGYRILQLKDILFVERSDRKNRIVLENGQEVQLYRYTLDELEQQLAGSGFYRCYQSFIVNLSKVAGIRADNDARNYTILFEGDRGEIMLSRNKYAEIVKLLQQNVAGVRL